MSYTLGFDIGSSFIKASILDTESGSTIASASSPSTEMIISSPEPGFAEQDPGVWWEELLNATAKLKKSFSGELNAVKAIGISYQMHGLVCIDRNKQVLRPAIIWCDSRAVYIGDLAFERLSKDYCLEHFLNSPGNFTASKLKWVKDHDPEVFRNIHQFLLPGDYIAMRLTGVPSTTIPGLSEGILWDFQNDDIAKDLLEHYGLDQSLIPLLVPTFGDQGRVSSEIAGILGIPNGTPVTYRSGDQPNNAFSLNVLNPGEVAATAGTSGVVYGIADKPVFDNRSRVNPFVHVNHKVPLPSYGILLCINGTGSFNSWLRKNIFNTISYENMNELAGLAPVGSSGLLCYPFGNGAERIFEGRNTDAGMIGLQFTRHHNTDIARAAQEGIVFAMNYGMDVMREMGMQFHTVRAGFANMFLSNVFASTFSNVTGCRLELYDTDGSAGAARGAAVGAKIFSDLREAFSGLHCIRSFDPDDALHSQTQAAKENWTSHLTKMI